jgi:integrase
MGMIYKRGNVWWIKYYRNGEPYRESSGSTKKMVAKKLLDRKEGEIALGKIPSIQYEKVSFDELAEDFLVDYRINKKKSLKRAENSVGHLRETFEGMRIVDITTPRIRGYIEDRMKCTCNECEKKFEPQDNCPSCDSEDLKSGAANATINRELAALKRMLKLGAQQTPPKVDRVAHIPMLQENNIRKGFFEHGDFLALRTALPFHLKGFITFGYEVGWRVSEIAGLTWKQVDLNQGIVRLEVGETKNDEARTVYLDEELQEIFNQQWELRKANRKLLPYVFLNKDGGDRVKRFDKSWKSACKDAGIGVRLFHDFRRTAVRNMVRSGIPERVAMMISGHKTRSVFDRYNIVNDHDLKLASKQQAAYLESQRGHNLGTIVDFKKKLKIENES